MPLQVYTTVIRRGNPACENIYFMNITVKSGNTAFAPTWPMVMGIKNGTMTEAEYSRRYSNIMQLSQEQNPQLWKDLLNREKAILACFCKPGEFCHRILLAKILEQMGAQYVGEI